ncbi:hypothetical protein AMATHDRAFT_68897 [Amanita thiersii Skay4041]|uniref:F-box domain-containing protein n=1 Tax=Amanita thiersii Skay4041 TaxID=703135 RepID=A0A2A9NGT7_9AGAR|nr:hypothetical protein AMATHDRAFT_68897 [Amanita thiersii Skay4041]
MPCLCVNRRRTADADLVIPRFAFPYSRSSIYFSGSSAPHIVDTCEDAASRTSTPLPSLFSELPLDVLQPILAMLNDRRDWHACTLVNRAFNRISTSFLYHTLDSRITKRARLHHPSTTLINRPDLARHVRHITETGAVHLTLRHDHPTITQDTLRALSLCTNLRSLTWIDDTSLSLSSTSSPLSLSLHPSLSAATPYPPRGSPNHTLLSLLSVIRHINAPLSELTIRSHSDLGQAVWTELATWTGLEKISVWCMEGPPRVLQGWAGPELGKTLRSLELGRCAGVPPTILITVLSQLPLLQDLRLKGAPASAVLTILSLLPNLQSLDTEYLISGSGNVWPRGWPLLHYNPAAHPNAHHSLPSPPLSLSETRSSPSPTFPPPPPPPSSSLQPPALPALRHLTVRTSSIDTLGPTKLFPWIRALVSVPGLESFRLLAFATTGYTAIPRGFLLEMGRVHGALCGSSSYGPAIATGSGHGPRYGGLDSGSSGWDGVGYSEGSGGSNSPREHEGSSLKRWIVGEAQMTLGDIECACKIFPALEELVCSVAVSWGDVDSITQAISSAKNLHTLRLHVQWIPPTPSASYAHSFPRLVYTSGAKQQQRQQQPLSPPISPRSITGSTIYHSPTHSTSAHLTSNLSSHRRHLPSPPLDNSPPLIAQSDSDIDSDLDVDEDEESGSGNVNTQHIDPRSRFRFSGDTGGRGAFGWDEVGLKYVNRVARGGDAGDDGEFDRNIGGGSRHPHLNSGQVGKENGPERQGPPFTVAHARAMMLMSGSKLRVVAVGGVVYTGKWVWDENADSDADGNADGGQRNEKEMLAGGGQRRGAKRFEVLEDVAEERWQT